MIFLGDVHCNINFCVDLATKNPDKTVLQVGDLGVGFVTTNYLIETLPANFKFFVGNHDNRTESYKIPNCLRDFGEHEGVFYVSGADSYDKAYRTEGIDWWPDEELTYKQCQDCLEQWKNSKCEIIVSHECPQSFAENFYLIYDKSRTRQLLQAMINARKPKVIISGHHHKRIHTIFNDIEWHSLAIDEVFELKI